MASLASSMSGSRSPSPETPGAEAEDTRSHGDVDLHAWLKPLQNDPTNPHKAWDIDPSLLTPSEKGGESDMMRLDELIEQHAYQDSPTIEPYALHNSFYSNNSPSIHAQQFDPSLVYAPSIITSSNNVPAPPTVSRRPVPIPSAPKTVCPPRDSCYNLPIMFPSIPENGVKSRVETQIRTTIELADASTSSDPHRYDRVGSWKWLRLPMGTASKRRSRKAQQLSADPDDTLDLSVSVTCATPPHNGVLSCSSCRNREAKRVAKKLASRVRTKRSDGTEVDILPPPQEDTTSIIQFNCPEVVDFSTGSVVLPLRITCYCRHHREKTGFNVHFTMMDRAGRIVGAGSTRPIMITDDHKTSGSTKPPADLLPAFGMMDVEWAQVGSSMDAHGKHDVAPSKRKQDTSARKTKPYYPLSPSRLDTTSAPVSSRASPITRTPSPSRLMYPEASHSSPVPQLTSSQDSESSPESVTTPVDYPSPEVPMAAPSSAIPSPQMSSLPMSALAVPAHPHPMSQMFFDFSEPAPTVPVVHRLIPNCGPTHGGIEVTILGANFLPSLQLTCMFGDVPASSTQRWSDNALVCVLPPRSTPGVVAVWFEGFALKSDGPNMQPPTLFTYSDESDRALMELALQVVGLKMTGKIEDAKNVAMRIVGGDSSSDNSGSNGSSNFTLATHTLHSTPIRDLRPLLLMRAGESEDVEKLIIDFLSIIDAPIGEADEVSASKALSHQTVNGQTMLHLAAFLGLRDLVQFLVDHDIDVDIRDRNGFTALHFAAFSGSTTCVSVLLEAGADEDIVNNLGKTAEEIAVNNAFGPPRSSSETESDEEATWGDGEEDAQEVVRKPRDSRRREHRSSLPPPSNEKAVGQVQNEVAIDEKHLATFLVQMIQRGLAQLPGGPQLPLEHLPRLPNMPIPGVTAAAWNALPQMPMAFPVFVPLLDLSAILGKETDQSLAWKARAAWEKWVATAPQATQQTKEATEETSPIEEEQQAPVEEERRPRRAGLDSSLPAVSAQEVDAFEYQPRPQQRKQDKMLILFWIPILFLSMLWALHHGFTFAFRAVRTAVPLRNGIRG